MSARLITGSAAATVDEQVVTTTSIWASATVIGVTAVQFTKGNFAFPRRE